MDAATAQLFGRVLQIACLSVDHNDSDPARRGAALHAASQGLRTAVAVLRTSSLLDEVHPPAAAPAGAAPGAGAPRQERLGAYLAQVSREQGMLPLVTWALAACQADGDALPDLAGLAALGQQDGDDLAVRMAQLALMGRSQQALARQGITSCVYKGVVLGELCYPRWELRQSGQDIDLLIAADDLDAASACLGGLGFQVVRPLPLRSRAFAMGCVGEVMLADAHGGIIDLHWTLHMPYYRFGPPTHAVLASSRLLDISGTSLTLRTLSQAETVLLVALHGAKEGWSQWRWLCDLALLLRTTPASQLREALTLARARGCETLVLAAISLVEHLARREQAALPELADLPERHPRAVVLARRWQAAAQGAVRSPHLDMCRAADRLGDRLRGLTATLRPWPIDWQDLDLPASLSWAYWLYRPWRLLARTLGWWRATPVGPPTLSDRPGPPGTPTPHH